MTRYLSAALIAPLLCLAPAAAQPSCTPQWSTGYPVAGPNDDVHCLLPWDDGRGPALFVGGGFTRAGTILTRGIARFDGSSWSPLGAGIAGSAYALGVYDDGSGPALYISGDFAAAGGIPASGVARWNGQSWSPLDAGLNGPSYSMAVFDDDGPGPGRPALYIAGSFTTAGGQPARGIARWNGQAWSDVGQGPGPIHGSVLAVHDDGSGPALYLGGQFTQIGGIPASSIAKWDGRAWSALASGCTGGSHFVAALRSVDLGGGPVLCAAGNFTHAGGTPTGSIAIWNGQWSPLGTISPAPVDYIDALAVHDDGSGPALIAAGRFAPTSIARWDGAHWTPMGQDAPADIWAAAEFDDGCGPALYIGGPYQNGRTLGSGSWDGLFKWDGGRWSAALGSEGADSPIDCIAPLRTPSGPAILVAGRFSTIGGAPISALALRDAQGWHDQGLAFRDRVFDAAAYHTPEGPVVFARGQFSALGPSITTAIRRAGAWTATATDHAGPLVVVDTPAGPDVHSFRWEPDGSLRLVRWDGSRWLPQGAPITGAGASRRATSFDDGDGPAIYLAGTSLTIGGVPIRGVARWDGQQWSQAGPDLTLPITALDDFDDGAGRKLHAAVFNTATQSADLLVLGGGQWRSIGSGPLASIDTLRAADDGRGPALFAAGRTPALREALARWDGRQWSLILESPDVHISAIGDARAQDGSRSLFIGGAFGQLSPNLSSANIAELIGCPPSPCYANCDGSTSPSGTPTLSVSDFICFLNRYAAADPYANCDGSTTPPTLGVSDFVCFLSRYAAGCP